MPRFRFPLEALLTVRREAERARQQETAELERQRARLEDRLRAQQQLIQGGRAANRERLVGRVPMDSLRMEAATGITAMREARRVVLALAGLHQRIEEARGRLAEATRERRAIERLRELRWAEWRREEARAEQKVLDDVAAVRTASGTQDADEGEGAPVRRPRDPDPERRP